MKKIICFLISIFILFFSVIGCENLSDKKVSNLLNVKIENTKKIEMKFGVNDYIAQITNEEKIEKLEDLFNQAKVHKADKPDRQEQLRISFIGEKGIKNFYIDSTNSIRLENGSYIKSKEIGFGVLFSMYREEMRNSSEDEKAKLLDEKIAKLPDEKKGHFKDIIEKIEIVRKVFMHDVSRNARIYNKEEIKSLEDLFNSAEFYEVDKPKFRSHIDLSFYGIEDTISFRIDEQDYIRLPDGRHVKSKEISYEKLKSILRKNVLRNREEIQIIPDGKVNNSLQEEIVNSSEIAIGYLVNSFTARITDERKIKELEDLFNRAEFTKSDKPITPALLDITFINEKGITRFLVSDNDVIVLEDGMYAKSKEIDFQKLYSIIEDGFTKYQKKFE